MHENERHKGEGATRDGRESRRTPMRRANLILGVLILAALTHGYIMGAGPFERNGIQGRLTQTTARGRTPTRNQMVSLAQRKTDTAQVLTDEDQFVSENLAKSGTGWRSKQGWFRSDLVDKVEARLKRSLNYNTLPARYRKLIDANRSNYFFLGADEKKPYHVFDSDDFSLREADGRTIVWHHKLDASKMMAIFEPVTGNRPFFEIPEKVMNTFPETDQVYARHLTEVVNEVVSYVFEVPFFIPDMKRFDRGDYAGKFIPEKYLITGKKLDRVPKGLVDPDKKDLYARWGWPVYDLSQVETGEIQDVSGCFYYSEYQELKVVDNLVVLNLDMAEDKNKQDSIDLIRIYQYERAQKDLEILKRAPAAEREALRAAGNLTPAREKVLTVLEKRLEKIIPPAERVLQQALDQKQFIFNLRQPGGQPKRMSRVGIMNTEFTSGRQKERGE